MEIVSVEEIIDGDKTITITTYDNNSVVKAVNEVDPNSFEETVAQDS